MKKRLPLLFLCIVTFINVSSTNIRDSICIAGRVSSTNDQPVEALIVTALLPSDSSDDKRTRHRASASRDCLSSGPWIAESRQNHQKQEQ